VGTQRKQEIGFAARVHEQFRTELYRFLVRRLGAKQDANDLEQEVYLRLLRLEKSELVRQPLAYVYTIAAHVAHQFRMRAEQSPVTFDSEVLQQAAEHPEHVADDRLADELNAQRTVESLLEKLPATHRAVLVLCKRDGLSYEEIAEKLGISEHTVKKYVYEAKARVIAMTRSES
jgi:RNA polymerase sigma-19 factor, ECF subfamily